MLHSCSCTDCTTWQLHSSPSASVRMASKVSFWASAGMGSGAAKMRSVKAVWLWEVSLV